MKNITLLCLLMTSFSLFAQQFGVNDRATMSNSINDRNNAAGCAVDNDAFFSGTYNLEATTLVLDPFNGFGQQYPDNQLIEIVASGTQRVFNFIIFPDSFEFIMQGTITLNCGEIEFNNNAVAGSLGCTGGANTVRDIHALPLSNYDENLIDDDIIEFEIDALGLDDGGCEVASYPITLRFEKQALSTTEALINEVNVYLTSDNKLNIYSVDPLVKIDLFSISGKQVITKTVITNQEVLDVSMLKSGIYIANIKAANGRQKVVKVIKQ